MFYPKLFNDDFFDDFMGFDFPRLRNDDVERQLYGKHATGLRKTDVRDKDGNYELDIDLPGFKKDEITLSLDNGYLIVGACKALNEEEKDDRGHTSPPGALLRRNAEKLLRWRRPGRERREGEIRGRRPETLLP